MKKNYFKFLKLSVMLLALNSTAFAQQTCTQPNLVVNGDFESGNTGFTSQYTHFQQGSNVFLDPPANTSFLYNNAPLMTDVQTTNYAIYDDYDYKFHAESVYWAIPGDHTTGTRPGKFMLIQSGGGVTNGTYVWKQTVTGLTPGAKYEFSYWAMDAVMNYDFDRPTQGASIDGTTVIPITTLPLLASESPSNWVQYKASFTADADGAAILEIFNGNTSTLHGNDWVLDDIKLNRLCPPVATNDSKLNQPTGAVTLNLLSNDFSGAGPAPVPANFDVDLDPSTPGNQSTFTNSDGTYVYNTATGALTFTPASGFTGNPTSIPYTITEKSTGLSSTANITITYNTLAVTFLYFNSSLQANKTVKLNWAVDAASQNGTLYYAIEKLTNTGNFTMIARVNPNNTGVYTYIDANVIGNKNYYRIKEVAVQNEIKYSEIRSVDISGKETLVITNNPSSNTINIYFTSVQQNKFSKITVSNSLGQVVYTKLNENTNAIETINGANLKQGIYYINVITKEQQFSKKVILGSN